MAEIININGSSSSVVDFRNYSTIKLSGFYFKNSHVNYDDYYEVFSITGEGFLDYCISNFQSSGQLFTAIKIELDGINIYESTLYGCASPVLFGGVVTTSFIGFEDTYQVVKGCNKRIGFVTEATQLPHSDLTNHRSMIVPYPLEFKTSLKVYCKKLISNASINNHVYVSGRIKND